jgi:hypothetical protein
MMKAIMRTVTILLFLTAFLVVSSPRSAQAATCTWKDGTTGDWNVAANWNNCNGLVPGVSDEAIISSGTVNVTEDASVGSLTMSGGTLTGDHSLTAGTINWSGGTMSGSGSTTATDEANFTGSYPLWLSERTFNNIGAATLSMTSVGRLDFNASAVFNNQAGATFTVESAGVDVVSGSGTFNNAGTLNLTTGKISAATFVQEPGGITNLTIKGNTPVTDYCQINASAVDLASPLNIGFSGGFTPHIGDEFILLSYGSTRIGDFSPVNVTPLADGFWSLFYEGNSLHLLAEEGQLYIVYLPLVVR